MCNYDNDPPDLSTTRLVTARKPSRCYECDATIAKGDTYRRTKSLYDGHWTTTRLCTSCDALSDAVENVGCNWSYGYLTEDAEGAIQDHDCDPVATGTLAGLLFSYLEREYDRKQRELCAFLLNQRKSAEVQSA